MRKLLYLAAITAFMACGTLQADTILVNIFSDQDTPVADTASASDYSAADAAVNGSASVFDLIIPRNGAATAAALPISGVADSGVGLDATVTVTAGGFGFNAANGALYGTTPVLDSYVAVNGAASPIDITIGGLSELQTGTNFTVTVYAVGDANNQGASTSLTYNGVTTAAAVTTASPGGVTSGQFTFNKVAGQNDVFISSVGETQFHAVNGFSVTGTLEVVPEPSAISLLALSGFVGVVRRRRK